MRIGWYSELNTNERRTYLACFWSYALESMDAQMFAIAIPALITYLGINRGIAGTIMMQYLPFADAKALAAYDAFERGAYQLVSAGQ